MNKNDAVNYFGSQTKMAKSLKRNRSTVSAWIERLPKGVQFEIQVRSKGKLKVDPELI